MKFTHAALAVAATIGSVEATWWNAPRFNTPGNCDNKCETHQENGWDFGDLDYGSFNKYKDFDFKGWTCGEDKSKRDLKTRTFGRSISGECGSEPAAAPSFGCGSSNVDKFSVKKFHVKPEFDCRLEFHYEMPDGSSCKHSADCSKDGTDVENTQCGGAKTVKFVYPKQDKPKTKCNIEIPKIDFDCQPPTNPCGGNKNCHGCTYGMPCCKPGMDCYENGCKKGDACCKKGMKCWDECKKDAYCCTPGTGCYEDCQKGEDCCKPGMPCFEECKKDEQCCKEGTECYNDCKKDEECCKPGMPCYEQPAESTTSAPPAENTSTEVYPPPGGDKTTSDELPGQSTTTAPGSDDETTTAPGAEETTTAPGSDDETTTAPGAEETTTAPGSDDETTTAPGADETTTAPGTDDETTTAPGAEETTSAPYPPPGSNDKTTSDELPGQSTTTAPGSDDETTTAPGSEDETTTAPEAVETTTAPVVLTTYETTSTVYTTDIKTITDCGDDVPDCPAGGTKVTTVVVPLTTTVCPVTETVPPVPEKPVNTEPVDDGEEPTKSVPVPEKPVETEPVDDGEEPTKSVPVPEKPVETEPVTDGEEPKTTESAPPVVTTYDTTSTIYTTDVKTITDCGDDVPDCPAGSTKVTTVVVPVTTTVCPVTETIPAQTKPVKPTKPAQTKPVEDGEEPKTTDTPKPETSEEPKPPSPLPCPQVVPSCLNTFLDYLEDCKDNTDAKCFCPKKDFVDKVFNCLYAHGENDDIVAEAVSFFQGICAPYVDENPGIVTGAEPITKIITVTGTTVIPTAAYTTVVVATTITEPCVTDGTTIEGSSTVYTVSTEVVVPDVGFTTAPSGGVGLVPPPTGTEVGALPSKTVITQAPRPTGTGGIPIPTKPGSPDDVPVINGAGRVGMGVAAALFAAALAL